MPAAREDADEWAPLGPGGAVGEGEAKGFVLGDRGGPKVILVRRGGVLHAYLDACPHHGGTPMAWRTNAYLSGDGAHLCCHSHNALFDIETGKCVLGPCLGQSLTSVAIREEDGIVLARL
ncbi:Rieske (2Fe-2S) protein [Allorhizobium undicola]|uniref:Rieske (2Fe-2S) protein n=1 Tax=Allorhizobium undicola TaxID=78527 RepID=UPI003D33985F